MRLLPPDHRPGQAHLTVALALYHGEDHGMGAWKRSNIEDYWERVWRWRDRWLGRGSTQ